MKDGFYWFRNEIGIWNPVCIIADFTKPTRQLVFYIGYSKPDYLERLDKKRFGPEIILPKELQNGNTTKDNCTT